MYFFISLLNFLNLLMHCLANEVRGCTNQFHKPPVFVLSSSLL